MTYTRLFTDDAGESHFEDVEMRLSPVDYAPPAPPLDLSESEPATASLFMSVPPGWDGDWHPSRRRQLVIVLEGEIVITASDGETRRFGPGDVTLGEDTAGRGHRSRAGAATRSLLAVVQLPD